MESYSPGQIEKKWQRVWEEKGLYRAVDHPLSAFRQPSSASVFSSQTSDFTEGGGQRGDKRNEGGGRRADGAVKPKFYALVEFPYPSGAGLHVGHVRVWSAMDAFTRKKRMEGYNVLFPMGWDAFGLPAENYAIKKGVHPSITTAENIANFKRQIQALGLSFDWTREVNTTDPKYYKWTQWIFLKLLEHGLAYQKEVAVNWCPFCKTNLADEEVLPDGTHERCGNMVEKRLQKQWLLAITKYADRLIEDLKSVDFPSKVSVQQINWIGRKEGASIKFSITNYQFSNIREIEIFTTRADTVSGATFLVIAPEHPLVSEILRPTGVGIRHPEMFGAKDLPSGEDSSVRMPQNDVVRTPRDDEESVEEVRKYVEAAKKKSDEERIAEGHKKTGVFTGVYAVNPATGKDIPVWVADYVLSGYGTGAIMAVPAHDERDLEFAKEYDLPVIKVVEPVTGTPQENAEFRQSIVAVVRNPSTGKYLSVNWGDQGGNLFIGGGREKGEDVVETARREVSEETGYTNLKLISQTGRIYHNYFAPSKNVARSIEANAVLFELIDEQKRKTRLEENEKGKFGVEWLSEQEIQTKVTDELHSLSFKLLVRNPVYTGDGVLINSGSYNGLSTKDAKKRLVENLEKEGKATATTTYHLHDWIFSRQHYWGEPIPVVYCENCASSPRHPELSVAKDLGPRAVHRDSSGRTPQNDELSGPNLITTEMNGKKYAIIPVPENQLPVELPYVEKYEPSGTGESPLAVITDWVNTKCPRCGGPAKRETDTMPNWAGSNWYYLGYLFANSLKNQNSKVKNQSEGKNRHPEGVANPKDLPSGEDSSPSTAAQDQNDERGKVQNDNGANIFTANKDAINHWMPVDVYEGGYEHTTLHLLYSRFIYKFLYDIKVVPTPEPYASRRVHGIVLGPDNRKMSKSLGNVINPDEIVEKFGADTLRMYEMFMGPFGETVTWNMNGVAGVYRFLNRVFALFESSERSLLVKKTSSQDSRVKVLLSRLAKKVASDLENMKFNTAVSAMMEFINEVTPSTEHITDNTGQMTNDSHVSSVICHLSKESSAVGHMSNEDWDVFVRILAPLAPHLAEELYQRLRTHK